MKEAFDCTCESMDETCTGPVREGMSRADIARLADKIHSPEWWDGTGPCSYCGYPTCPAVDSETGEHQ